MSDSPDTGQRTTAQRRLRILHVLRAPLGGLWRHVVDLTREQVARGHEVGLIVDSLTGGERAAQVLAELEPTLALGIARIPMLRHPHVLDAFNVLTVERHVRRTKADVVHGHGSKGGLYARLPALWRRRGAPARGYTPHGGSFNHVAAAPVQALYMGVESLLATRTDVLLFESVFIANRFHDRVGETQALVRIVQNGIAGAEFCPVAAAADAADFLYVGELRSAKGIDTLIDATALLTRRLARPPSLILVGSGPDQEQLRARATARGIAGQVTFPGAMPARQAFALGRTLVVPSRAESLPYIVLEAAGAQIPMVATDVGGIGEIFGPHRDRLIACNDPRILADSMQRNVETEATELKRQAAELAAYVAGRFTIGNMVDSVIAGYRDALSRRDAAPSAVGKLSAVTR